MNNGHKKEEEEEREKKKASAHDFSLVVVSSINRFSPFMALLIVQCQRVMGVVLVVDCLCCRCW